MESTTTTPSQKPLTRVINNNDPPTLEERQLAQKTVHQVDRELGPLRIEIKALEQRLSQLKNRAQVLEETRSEHVPILSPWRRLPTEILAEIMQTAVNPGSLSFLSESNKSTDRQHFRSIRGVCKLWREVAFATHSLWTSVWIDFDDYPEAQVPNVVRGVGKYFERAGPTLPLNVGFKWRRDPTSMTVAMPEDVPEPDLGEGAQTVAQELADGGVEGAGGGEAPATTTTTTETAEQPVGTEVATSVQPVPVTVMCPFSDLWLGYLFSQRSRWEEISFFAETYHFQLFETKLKFWLPTGATWKTLFLQVGLYDDIYQGPDGDPDPVVDSTLIRTTFPELETINLNAESDVLINVTQSKILNGHSELRKLRLEIYRDINPYLSKLGGFPHLKKLLLNCPKLCVRPMEEEGPVFDLPQLELLVISCIPSFSLLSKLYAPNIRTLQILTNVPPDPTTQLETTSELQQALWNTFPDMINFVRQSEGNLKELHLNCWFVQDDDSLRRLFEAISSVEKLCIDTWFQHDLLDIDHYDSDSIYLPNLQKFCLHPLDENTLPPSPSSSSSCRGPGHCNHRSHRDRRGIREADASDIMDTAGADGSAPSASMQNTNSDAAPATGALLAGSSGVGGEVNMPFSRQLHSWRSLGTFLDSKRGTGNAGQLEICLPVETLVPGGQDAREMAALVKRSGLKLEVEPSCRIFW
ncbi:hypothetical protein EST38_g1007 [Candolleomyces aberdarensis]|uniref:Uncharacterized protein n=1 Tax=Candolleomyces aberdarensis TaxID=2316362 RepID=A0A4Q2DW21_9AGAR|nr:hypothetical protein EST38_g1007 [Candolleomyces aberdarensis]